MKKISIIIASIFLIIACAGTSSDKIDGEKLYKQNCVICHGIDGKLGINGAKDITASPMTLQERIENIREGKNAMTGFKNLLSKEEIEAIAKYTLKLK